MKEKEKQFQRALGTLDHYIVSLCISRRTEQLMAVRRVEAGNEQDAFEEAVRHYMKDNSAVRRDQITLNGCYKSNF